MPDLANANGEKAGPSGRTTESASWVGSHGNAARRILSLSDAVEVADLLLEESVSSSSSETIAESDCRELISAALDKGNVKLAMSMHAAMRASARRPRQSSSSASFTGGAVLNSFVWPTASILSTCTLVLGLCKQLAIGEATRIISEIRVQGVPRHEEVGFGRVITSPLAPGRTLTVVQPQEGSKLVADAYSKYEYEVCQWSMCQHPLVDTP